MRKVIAAMKMSVDGKVEGPDGIADWVDAWSEDYGLTEQVDACVLGGGMFPGYEEYWTAIQNEPEQVHPLSGQVPTPAEVAWGQFAQKTPHYVLSSTVTSSNWPNVKFLRSSQDVAALKEESGKDIYLVGGPRATESLLDEGLVDELRLIVYPLVVGVGTTFFSSTKLRRGLELQKVEELTDGRLRLRYGVGQVLTTG